MNIPMDSTSKFLVALGLALAAACCTLLLQTFDNKIQQQLEIEKLRLSQPHAKDTLNIKDPSSLIRTLMTSLEGTPLENVERSQFQLFVGKLCVGGSGLLVALWMTYTGFIRWTREEREAKLAAKEAEKRATSTA